jgi:putative aldouronate transport system permease protein
VIGLSSKKKDSFIRRLLLDIKKDYVLYIMIIPVVVYYILFAYVPMAGIQLAFKNYSIKKGIWGSDWVGLEHFQRFLSGYNFKSLLTNTITLSLYSLILGIITPIIFALFLNYVKSSKWKKVMQMVTYLPYFISTVVMVGILHLFLGEIGMFNNILEIFGLKSIPFLTEPNLFKSVYAWSGAWQGLGFSSIIYIASFAGVDYGLHEAAIMDGASKWRRVWHIDLVEVRPTIILMVIMGLGGIINVGFEKVLLMQNQLNFASSDVISTYVYRIGLVQSDYGYSTAVGLFNGVISSVLLIVSNRAAKKTVNYSMW